MNNNLWDGADINFDVLNQLLPNSRKLPQNEQSEDIEMAIDDDDYDDEELPDSEGAVLTSSKGKPMLNFDGFTYHKTKTTDEKIYWICNEYRSRACKASMITSKTHEFKKFGKHKHFHAPNAFEKPIRQAEFFIKVRSFFRHSFKFS